MDKSHLFKFDLIGPTKWAFFQEDGLVPLIDFTLYVTAQPTLQIAIFRHKGLTDSLINREVTWQSSKAHQYYFLIQMNEMQLN